MVSPLRSVETKSVAQVRDDYLDTYANGLRALGIDNPDTSYGTEIFVRATALSQEIGYAAANVEIRANAGMPDSAMGENGEDLLRLAARRGLSLRPAGGSNGKLLFAQTLDTPVAVPLGIQLLDNAGLRYRVAVGGSYNDGDPIDIEAIDTGVRTNLEAGSTLRWVTPPPFAAETADVADGGLIDGCEAETLEGLRQRLLDDEANPAGGGNPTQVAQVAENSTTAVQKAFVYSCYSGPSTMAVVVVGPPSATNKTRVIDDLIITSKVEPAVVGEFVEFADILVQSVTDQEVDVAIALQLGTTNGWRDATPFPVFASDGRARVTAVTSTTQITIKSDVPPAAGRTHICWLSQNDWKLYRATVLSYTGTGPYDCVLDTPFVGIAVDDFISPEATNIAAYFDELLAQFALLGPGEKTNLAGLLQRALRKPRPEDAYPMSLGSSITKAIENLGSEVTDASYTYRSATTPTVPATVDLPPNQLVPRRLAFYPAASS